MANDGPPRESLSMLVRLVERQVGARVELALEAAGLTPRHFGALGHLRREPGLSVSEVARRARITPQSMHTTIGELERDGLVARAETGRGRKAGLVVTPAGVDRLESGRSAVAAIDDELRTRLGAEAYDAVVAGLVGLMRPGPPD